MEGTGLWPEAFRRRMQEMLGDEYDAFAAAMAMEKSVHALLLNPQKPVTEESLRTSLLRLPPVSYRKDAFLCEGEGWGAHALHRAGAYYLQDPGAMAPVSSAPVEKGWHVLDLCAAPGGKTAQLSLAVGEEGWVVSNEMNPSRCRILAGNVERLGLKNVTVLNGDGNIVAGFFPDYFDLVLVDAPCSGEGMFRKNPEALRMWNEGNVRLSAERQKELLKSAASAVAPGGFLLYSTCTFSPEEDEEQIADFLEEHTDFALQSLDPSVAAVACPGNPSRRHPACPTEKTARFYPHRTPGEGQFCALMKRSGSRPERRRGNAFSSRQPSGEERSVAQAFLKDTLRQTPNMELIRHGKFLALVPENVPIPEKLVFSPGVTLGEMQKGRLIPHPQFFSAFGTMCRRVLDLNGGSLPWTENNGADARLSAYLHGEVLGEPAMEDGWGCLLVNGCPLGGFKAVDGQCKNHYPKGLRI